MIRTISKRSLEKLRGVTLVELLVVLLIISLLATAAVPVLITRIQDARIATARQDVSEIAKAEDMVSLFHGVYVPLQMLDDLPRATGVSATTGTDDIDNSANDNLRLIQVTLAARSQTGGNQPQLGSSAPFPIGDNILTQWQGPFLNPNRVYFDAALGADAAARRDHPLDPWGQPYRFFSPEGIIGSSANSTASTGYGNQSFGDGIMQTSNDLYDRYAIVSLGPDGLFNTSFSDGDDIVYLFGLDPNESSFSGGFSITIPIFRP